VLSYAYADARRIQCMLGADTDLMCTSGTGIILQCVGAARTWRQVECREGPAGSGAQVSDTRALIRAQVAAILAGAGKGRWCELATVSASAAQAFLQVFPDAAFVCVHISCQDFIRAEARAGPWVMQRQVPAAYLLTYRGNTVAALAAYWARSAEQLLAFEQANPRSARRILYQDVTGDATTALGAIRAWLRLDSGAPSARFEEAELPEPEEPATSWTEPPVPLDLIPRPLRDRVAGLDAELGVMAAF
jgi:hypothetical protein